MYSVRMRAAKDNRHISGAENLVDEKEIRATAHSLIERALSHERGKPDLINISVEEIKSILGDVEAVQLQAEGLAAAPGHLLDLRGQRGEFPCPQEAVGRKGLANAEHVVADGEDLEI